MDAELEGYAWLPRMLDKARLTAAGEADGLTFGCPVDHTCLARLGVAQDELYALAVEHDDAGVLAALRARPAGLPSAQEAWFDAVAVEDELQERGTYLRVRAAADLPADRERAGRVFDGADHGAGVTVVVLQLDAGASEGEEHAHETEEVIAVTAGAAHMTLGAVQQRIVRAGEVVRVPAGVAHSLRATADGALVAVAARVA